MKKPIILLLLILSLAFVLRAQNLSGMAHFEHDQEYAANFAYSVIKEYPIQLIGQGLSIRPFFMGPIYFYFLTPFFFLSNLHPIGGAFGSIILGLINILVIFIIGQKMFNKATGLIGAFIYAFAFRYIDYDWNATPTYSSFFIVLLTWFCFYKLWHGNFKFLPFLAFLFGLYTSIHPIYFPFYIAFLVLLIIRFKKFYSSKKFPSLKQIILAILLFLVPLSPLLLFESLRGFFELKQFIEFYQANEFHKIGSGTLLHYFYTIFTEPYQIFNLRLFNPDLLFMGILTIVLLLNFAKVGFWKDRFHAIALVITFLTFLFYYARFPGQVPEYYFLALAFLTIFYLSATLSLLLNFRLGKIILSLILGYFLIYNFGLLQNRYQDPSLINLKNKDEIVKEIVKRQPKDSEFFASYIANPGWNTGFDYLFSYYERVPKKDAVKKQNYTLVLPKSLSPGSINISSGNVGLILPR